MKIKIYQVNSDRDVLRVKFMGLQKTQNIQRSNGRSALIDPTLYDEVFSGEVDCLSLEDIYTLFNTDHPPFHRGHSLSISDVVEVLSAPEIVGQIRYQSAPGFYESTNYTDFTCYTNDVHEAEENDRDFEAIDYSDKNIPAVKNGFYYCDSFGFEHTQFHAKQTYKPENLLRVVALEPGKPAYEAEVADHFRAFQQAVAGKFEVTYPFKGSVVAISTEIPKIRNGRKPHHKRQSVCRPDVYHRRRRRREFLLSHR